VKISFKSTGIVIAFIIVGMAIGQIICMVIEKFQK
jgi:hypothetical protein